MQNLQLAVVGMDAVYGEAVGLAAFARALYDGLLSPNGGAPTLVKDVIRRALHDAGVPTATPVLEGGDLLANVQQAYTLLTSGQASAVAIGQTVPGGAGALVLKRRDQAEHDRIYALLAGISGSAPDAGYAELIGSPTNPAASRLFPKQGDALTTALGVSSEDGAILGVIKAALCLYQRFIPAWTAQESLESLRGTALYTTPKSKPWIAPAPRTAAVQLLRENVVLSLIEVDHDTGDAALHAGDVYLFPLAADGQTTLEGELAWLEDALRAAPNARALRSIADQAFARYDAAQPFALGLVGETVEKLLTQIESARSALTGAFTSGSEWTTPQGSYFTANPQGEQGKVAFVYPGAFNAYPRLSQDLLHLFPRVYDRFNAITPDAAGALAEELIYPRALGKPTHKQSHDFKARLENNPTAMIEAGIGFSVLYTLVLREMFNVQPDAAFGYSLGEGTMMWALGVWTDSQAGSANLRATPLYHDRLVGQMKTLRAVWGLPDDAHNFWAAYFISAPAEAVAAQVRREPRVYLTHINTPNEVMIAGDPAGCQRVVVALNADHLHAPFNVVIHCEAMLAEYDRFYDLHHYPISADPGVTFYSAADYLPMPLHSEAIAHSIARVSCKQVDFPRLIERAYADGVRIFLELGPRASCTRWIDETLTGRDHLAVAFNPLGVEDHTAIVRMVARLISHRVPLDLSPLYQRLEYAAPALSAPTFTPASAAHAAFLQARLQGLQGLGSLIGAQMAQMASGTLVTAPPPFEAPAPRLVVAPPKPALFDERRVREFATGSVAACFGDEYRIYEDRRAPRIPNGDLLLMTRAMEIHGTRHRNDPMSSIVAEYDVPTDAWFYEDNNAPVMAYSIYMEIAMQPCGFLSAYLGPTLAFPDIDFYFRNLDGRGHLISAPDLRGRTITNRVRMLTSTTLDGVIIQKFDFALSVDGETFFEGDASFGYFTKAALSQQIGLDKGKTSQAWHQSQGIAVPDTAVSEHYYRAPASKPYLRLPSRQLDFLDRLLILPHGGANQQGYVYAENHLTPGDWFFSAHFYQDPVMPGSLGVEAILESLQAYALETGLGDRFTMPFFAPPIEHQTTWRYRGQVIPTSRLIKMEAHIKRIDVEADRTVVVADASLWRDDNLRIYEVKDAAIAIYEANG